MCFIASVGGLAAGRLAVLAAHAGGQVVGADEDGVDAGHGKDGVGVLDGRDVLALEDDEQFLVGVGEVVGGGGAEIERRQAAADAAVAARRIEHGGDGGLGLGPAVDHRHDDAVRAVVEDALDVVVAVGRHPRQGGAAGVGDGAEHRPAVSMPTRLCSISTVSQWKPARARNRAAGMLPSDSQVPTDGWPALRARLTGLGRIVGSLGVWPREGARIASL